jgi:photosystem II stability/assembly factor-like uncharacterized protein
LWSRFGPEIEPLSPRAIAFGPVDDGTVYFAAEAKDDRRGVFRSEDDGGSWSISGEGLMISTILSIDVKPDDPSVVYACESNGPSGQGTGIYVSRDAASSWSLPENAREAGPVVVADPAHPDVVYASGQDDSIVKSLDGGATWFEVWPGFSDTSIEDLEMDPSGTALYAVVGWHHTLHRSVDGGETWVQSPLSEREDVLHVFCDPGAPGVVFASTYHGLFMSRDWGDSWSLSSNGLDTTEWCRPLWCGDYYQVTEMAFDPSDPDVMYAGTEVGPYRSIDGGATWEQKRDGMLVCCEIDGSWTDECDGIAKIATSGPLACYGGTLGLAVDPEDPSTVYSTSVLGTYRSFNRGERWLRIGVGQEPPVARSLEALGDGVLLGTSLSSGVLEMRVTDPQRMRRGPGSVTPSSRRPPPTPEPTSAVRK